MRYAVGEYQRERERGRNRREKAVALLGAVVARRREHVQGRCARADERVGRRVIEATRLIIKKAAAIILPAAMYIYTLPELRLPLRDE